VVSHECPTGFHERFVAAGFRARDFFPHRIRVFPKCGPDGAKLAKRMCGIDRPDAIWQVVLHATSPAIDEVPPELFFDRDVAWHQQHFHEPGQVASVTAVVSGSTLYTMAHQSDLVQRISRRREHKTRVEKVFAGWHHLLLNAVAALAVQRNLRELRVPGAGLMMQHTDPARTPQPELFERVYDRAVQHHYRATPVAGWWSIDIPAHRSAIVMAERREEIRSPGKTVCVLHDVERGLGHRDVDPAFAARADTIADGALDAMLETESTAGVPATYAVVGSFMHEVRDRIESDQGAWRGTHAGGHALAFHSFDHVIEREQLGRCRQVDYRLKGYRPPRSRLSRELDPATMCWYNFEWLASSASSLGTPHAALDGRLVRIPVHIDDFGLHTGAQTWEAWLARVRDLLARHDLLVIGLHDCYAPHWLPRYGELLSSLRGEATLRTLDEVADDVFLTAAR
jgi:hypothetical protein